MHRVRLGWVAASIAIVAMGPAHAGDGEVDASFGTSGFIGLDTPDVAGADANGLALYTGRRQDARLVSVSQAKAATQARAVVSVASPDGIDVDSIVVLPDVHDATGIEQPVAAAVQTSLDQLVIAGNAFDTTINRNRPFLVRLLPPDYAPDPDYNGGAPLRLFGGSQDAVIRAMQVDANDGTVICGDFAPAGNPRRGYCGVIRADGTPATFGTNGLATFRPATATRATIDTVALDAADRIVVAGHVVGTDLRIRTFVARFTPAGVPDETFCAGGCDDDATFESAAGYRIEDNGNTAPRCHAIATRADDSIVLASFPGEQPGVRIEFETFGADGALAQLTALPATLSAFGCGSLALQPDGRAVIGFSRRVSPTETRAAIARIDADDATLDGSFSANALSIAAPVPPSAAAVGNECRHVLVEADGILCSGLARPTDAAGASDPMFVRVTNGLGDDVFADGFEGDPVRH